MKPLNEKDLYDICDNDTVFKKAFGGVFARGEYLNMSLIKTPMFIIQNNDFNDETGRHWCMVMYFKKKTIYFDSFGFNPETLGYRLILERNGIPLEYCIRPIQSPLSSACGYHCLNVAYLLLKRKSLYDITFKYYSKNLTLNDDKAFEFLTKRLWNLRRKNLH